MKIELVSIESGKHGGPGVSALMNGNRLWFDLHDRVTMLAFLQAYRMRVKQDCTRAADFADNRFSGGAACAIFRPGSPRA